MRLQPDPPKSNVAKPVLFNKAIDVGPPILSLFREFRDARELWHIECNTPGTLAYNNPTFCGVDTHKLNVLSAVKKPVSAPSKPKAIPVPKAELPEKVEKECKVCGCLFVATGQNRFRTVYCTNACSRIANKRKPKVKAPVVCDWCLETFTPSGKPGRFCCNFCSRHWWYYNPGKYDKDAVHINCKSTISAFK